MPNWCYNTLAIQGEPKEIVRFIKANIGTTVQYPAIMTPSGKTAVSAQACTEAFFCFNAMVPMPQEVIERGYFTSFNAVEPDGLRWSIANWGCKWDIWNLKITPEIMGFYDGCQQLMFSFETPDGAPLFWFIREVQSFPELDFQIDYAEPNRNLGCTIYGEDGFCKAENLSAERKALEFAMLDYQNKEVV